MTKDYVKVVSATDARSSRSTPLASNCFRRSRLQRRVVLPARRAPPEIAQHPRRPRGHRQRQVRGLHHAAEPGRCGRGRTAHLPGHRHGHLHRPQGRDVLDGADDAKCIAQRRLRDLQRPQPALFAGRAFHDDRREEFGTNLPAQIDILRRQARHGVRIPLHHQGRRLGQQDLPLPADQGVAERGVAHEIHPTAYLRPRHVGLPALPPGHCIGGTSAEMCLSTVKKASAGYLDELPTSGNEGGRCFRDLEWEEKVLKICQQSGVGAQFGGKVPRARRARDAPRHAASCPVAIGVSCSADRNIKAKITPEGIFLEQLEKNPARFLPGGARHVARPWTSTSTRAWTRCVEILSKYPIKTRLNLRGTLIVARDIAHARIKQMLDEGKPMPEYFKKHPVYYAGPAKTPQRHGLGIVRSHDGRAYGSHVDLFQSLGGSLVMVAKGNRTQQVTDACKSTAVSTSVRSAARQRSWRRTPSNRSRSWTSPNWAWRPSARSTSRISRRSSSSMTKTFFPKNRPRLRGKKFVKEGKFF